MSRLLCCLCARHADMGAALSHPQEGEACEGAGVPAAPPTMADVIRERKKKAGGAGLGTLRRRIAAAARRPRDQRPDRGCEHARFIRSVVSSWRLAEVFLLCEELEAGAALRDLATQADLAREPALALGRDLATAHRDRWWCDVELVGVGWSLWAHRAILAARCTYFRDLLDRYPPSCCRVPLDGVCSALSYEEVEACVCALYSGATNAVAAARSDCSVCNKWDRSANNDGDLDIINVDNSNSCRSGSMCRCTASRRQTSAALRLAPLLGFNVDSLHRDMRYLLDSGEMCDARLVFRLEGGCSSYGFHSALELPCHRVVLAARSRFFRSVMSRRSSSGAGVGPGVGVGIVAVDEQVLPRRFARALLHAAYTDQLDLALVGDRAATPTSSTNGHHGAGTTGWPGVARNSANGGRPTTAAALDDAFQLYEIARFLEMAIVVQGCEDAIVEALNPETLPHVLRWAAQPHASHWVHRQAMRYLRDEFPAIMASAGAARLPRVALADALSSPFLQASEPQALRALLRWGAHQPQHQSEPNVVWHTGHAGHVGGGSRRGAGRRRDASDAALRESLASLIALVRTEHIPPDNELLNQLIRRGVVSAGVRTAGGSSADSWLARGNYRPPRCFLPYLDEIKALLEDQAVPEAEVSRVRRARYLHRIPDTLYMVAAARNSTAADPPPSVAPSALESLCVSPRVLGRLRARVRELRHAAPALTALALHHSDKSVVYRQIALRAVREMSLPDACAELLLADIDTDREHSEEWESPQAERRRTTDRSERNEPSWNDSDQGTDCCRSSSGSLRCPSTGSLRGNTLHIPIDGSRVGTCRRELPSRSVDTTRHRQSGAECAAGVGGVGAGAGAARGEGAGGRLSAAVPDVAMAPNANTHLLTNRDYYRHPLTADYSGVVLQLDLGDGATHTPRPGSRAQRANAAAHSSRQRDHSQAMSCLRTRPDDDELRAAIELSVIRAYSTFQPRAPSPSPAPVPVLGPAAPSPLAPPPAAAPTLATPAQPHQATGRCRAMHSTLPHGGYRQEMHPATHHAGALGRSSASPASLAGAAGAAGASNAGRHHELRTPPPHHYSLSRVSVSDRSERSSIGGEANEHGSRSPTPSPRRLTHHEYSLYRHHDYRVENVGAGGSGVRGSSPGGGYA